MNRPVPCCAIALAAMLLVTACGQKGPLYLPEDAESMPPAQEPADPENEPAGTDASGE